MDKYKERERERERDRDKDDQGIMDKSMRSVFVGNIPYDATEEKLKDIFSEVGPVLSFKLVFDSESGKPKGYGFCEYKDQETALSAMRNLNGYEIGGRSLRVDNACTEKSRMEMQALMQGPTIENPYGEPVPPDKAPETISKAVASLPPEQMFELMKQMKLCIQNNPNEARIMLIQNPQLAYALLQAQVVMRIIDPTIAVTMLHPKTQAPSILQPVEKPMNVVPPSVPIVNNMPIQNIQNIPQNIPPPQPVQFPGVGSQDIDLRSLEPVRVDPRMMAQRNMPPQQQSMDQDMRSLPPQMPPVETFNRDPRTANQFPVDPRAAPQFPADPRAAPQFPADPRAAAQFPADPRLRPNDPRQAPKVAAVNNPVQNPVRQPVSSGIPSGASDQEKAALIMQVLQLSDEQIAMLPPEQRTSILVLKEQIAKSTQR